MLIRPKVIFSVKNIKTYNVDKYCCSNRVFSAIGKINTNYLIRESCKFIRAHAIIMT